MSSENYYNHYVQILTSTMTDAIIRNVSLQASVKVNEESTKELNEVVEQMDAEIGLLKQQLEKEKLLRNDSENSRIKDLQNQVDILNSQLNVLRSSQNEYENVKSQVSHLETFKSQLISSREENKNLLLKIEELNKKIEYLQLPPAKRKKIDDLKTKEDTIEETVKDGGNF